MSVDWSRARPELVVRAGFLAWIADQAGFPLRFTSVWRSTERQAELYAQLGPGRAAPPGRSRHEVGRAFDVVFRDGEPYPGAMQELGKVGEMIGLRWGGSFKTPDPVHFDL